MRHAIAQVEESVSDVAEVLLVSEYEVFEIAYRLWFREPAPRHFLDACFVAYLRGKPLPVWVRDFARRTSADAEELADYPRGVLDSLLASLRDRFARRAAGLAEIAMAA